MIPIERWHIYYIKTYYNYIECGYSLEEAESKAEDNADLFLRRWKAK